MNRAWTPLMVSALALVLPATIAPTLSAADVTVKVTLNQKGSGDVFMKFRTSLDQRSRLASLADPRVKDAFLVKALLASPAELTELLRGLSFSGVVVDQKVDVTRVYTDVTATLSDVRPLSELAGGSLDFSPRPNNYVELSGRFGGALAGQDADLSALASVPVTLWIVFPGTVRSADRVAKVSHTASDASWCVSADRLLAEGVSVKATVLPRIEGTPQYWLALILAVTALVVIGALIILRRGREARLGSDR